MLPCIVISVKYPQFGQMIDFGFSENEMMDECLPLTLRVGDYKRNIQLIDNINHCLTRACLVLEQLFAFSASGEREFRFSDAIRVHA